MPTLRANGIALEYELHGSGEPVVLITGLGYSRWCWRYVVPFLAERFQVLTFDNRGAGGSEKPPGPYTSAMMAADTLGLLEGLGLGAVHVVGHSLGSMVAQELALARPERVRSLVLISSTFGGPRCVPITPPALQVMMDRSGPPEAVIERSLAVALGPGFAERCPEVVRELKAYRLGGPVPPEQYSAQLMAGVQHDSEVRLAGIRCPILLVSGQEDQVVPAANMELMRAKVPHAAVELFPGVGHMVPVEIPEALSARVRRFLTEAAPG